LVELKGTLKAESAGIVVETPGYQPSIFPGFPSPLTPRSCDKCAEYHALLPKEQQRTAALVSVRPQLVQRDKYDE